MGAPPRMTANRPTVHPAPSTPTRHLTTATAPPLDRVSPKTAHASSNLATCSALSLMVTPKTRAFAGGAGPMRLVVGPNARSPS